MGSIRRGGGAVKTRRMAECIEAVSVCIHQCVNGALRRQFPLPGSRDHSWAGGGPTRVAGDALGPGRRRWPKFASLAADHQSDGQARGTCVRLLRPELPALRVARESRTAVLSSWTSLPLTPLPPSALPPSAAGCFRQGAARARPRGAPPAAAAPPARPWPGIPRCTHGPAARRRPVAPASRAPARPALAWPPIPGTMSSTTAPVPSCGG